MRRVLLVVDFMMQHIDHKVCWGKASRQRSSTNCMHGVHGRMCMGCMGDA